MPGETDRVRWRGVRPVYGIRGVWPAIDATRIHKTVGQNGTGTSIVYTIPSGKKVFIASAVLTSFQETAAKGTARMGVRDDSDVFVYWIFYDYYLTTGQRSTAFPISPALEVEAGYDVFVQSTHADLDCRGIIHGWEEDE